MSEFRIDAAPDPRSVPALLEQWAGVAAARELSFVLPKEPLHPSAVVLLGAMAAGRRRRGLSNRAIGDATANPMAQLEPIVDRKTARRLADDAANAMEALAPPPSPSIVRMARFVFEELGVNIVDHSDRPDTGYGCAVVQPSARRLELAFADAGIGFRASLQRNAELEGRIADDGEALQLAVTPHISGTSAPRRNMGWGLKQLLEFSDLLGGDLWIASGSAMLVRRTTAGQRANLIRSIPPWQGSWIALTGPVG
jgi:hypothetical protein